MLLMLSGYINHNGSLTPLNIPPNANLVHTSHGVCKCRMPKVIKVKKYHTRASYIRPHSRNAGRHQRSNGHSSKRTSRSLRHERRRGREPGHERGGRNGRGALEGRCLRCGCVVGSQGCGVGVEDAVACVSAGGAEQSGEKQPSARSKGRKASGQLTCRGCVSRHC